MKLMILSATHNVGGARGPIYKLFLKRMARIRERFGVELLVVGSEGDVSKEPTVDSGAHYIEFPNNPVSNKWNAGMIAVKDHDPDFVMIMGSDDFISDNLIEKYLEVLSSGKYNVMGIVDSYYCSYNIKRAHFGQCLYWAGYPKRQIIGYGRCFGRNLLEAVGWEPWPEGLNAGLDFAASRKLKGTRVPQNSYKFSIREEGCFHIDIKTRGNISSLAPIVRRSTELNLDIETLLSTHLPTDEVNGIMSYLNELKVLYANR